MIRIKLSVISILLLVSVVASADDWTDPKGIQSVQVMNHGGFMIILKEPNRTICTQDDATTILFYPNHNGVTYEGAKSLLSSALIAFTTDTKVNVMYSYSINSDYCWGKVIRLSR